MIHYYFVLILLKMFCGPLTDFPTKIDFFSSLALDTALGTLQQYNSTKLLPFVAHEQTQHYIEYV